MIDLHFTDAGVEASAVDNSLYVARYIINKEEIFSRIVISKIEKFENLLDDYSKLHLANTKLFNARCDDFYERIVENYERRSVLKPAFVSSISTDLNWEVYCATEEEVNFESLTLDYDRQNGIALIDVDAPDSILEFLNQSESVRKLTADAFLKIYRYAGPFSFECDSIPF